MEIILNLHMQVMSTPKSHHVLLLDHIIKLEIKDDEIIEAEDMRAMHLVNLELSKQKPFGVILNVRKHFVVTKEARELLASSEFSSHHIASAFIVRSLASKLTGNFFIRFNKPKNPTKLFSDEAKALAWIKKVMQIK